MLELTLLGNPSAALHGQPLAASLLNKDLALLYYLAVSGQPQPRASLAVLLWGDHSEAAARGNLRKSLSALRQCLGPTLVVERDHVALVRAQTTVDLWEFERLARSGLAAADPAQLAAAGNLYRGDFLAGFSVRNAVDYDRWLYNMQEQLRGLAAHVFTTLAACHTSGGDWAAAIKAQRRVLAIEPWREEAHRELMLLLARSGQRGAALAQYKTCRQVLAEELGVEPSAETEALAEQLRAAAPTPLANPPPAPHTPQPPVPIAARSYSNLPPELAPIVGRTQELSELAALLRGPDCRLVTLLGIGGIGKTRLALALAHRLRGEFADVAMVSLRSATRAGEILPTLGRLFGAGGGPGTGQGDDVPALLRRDNPHLLLVLDNFEHLLPEGVAVLEQLLSEAPRLRCVVTSRAALAARWEWRYPLAELPFPAEAAVDAPGDYDSVRLFLQVAARVRPRQAIAGDELKQAMRICRLVGGMPLGVELAATQVGSLSCAAIAEQLAAGVERLEADVRDLPASQRSLAASFEVSWTALSPQEQNVLARLAVIQGEWTLEAALTIAEATVADIMHLVDKSLLRPRAEFYSLHEVVKQHARRKLDLTPGAAATTFARYRDYYTAWGAGNGRFATAGQAPSQNIISRLDNQLQHLWYIWMNSSDQMQMSRLALAVTEAERMYRATLTARGAYDTWTGLELFSQAYAGASGAFSGVLMVDAIWLPFIAERLVDLGAEFAAEAASLLPVAVEACSLDGRLLALPKDIDLGFLYSRRDLLRKYGFAGPPATWDELEHMAAVIQAGEREAGSRDFWGFVWPGRMGESLTCTALEWQHSEGGGCIVEEDGRISIANGRAAGALARAARWVGTISPPYFGDIDEDETMLAWQGGGAAFMRSWSTYFAIRLRGAMHEATTVTVLPRGSHGHAATLGGWHFAVHRSFQQRKQAVELIKAICAPEVQHMRAQQLDGCPPAIAALYHDPAVLAVHPYLEDVHRLIVGGGLAVRPYHVTGKLYAQVSALYAATVTAILRGQAEALPALQELERSLVELGGWGAATPSSTVPVR